MSSKSQLDHYHAIIQQELAVRKASDEYVAAKEEARDCKQTFDKLNNELLYLIHEGSDPQEKLAFEGEEK